MNKILLLLAIPFLVYACSSDPENEALKNVEPVNIQFLETYSNSEIASSWSATAKWVNENDSILAQHYLRGIDLIALVQSDIPNGIGTVRPEYMNAIDTILSLPEIKILFPKDIKFMWSLEPEKERGKESRYVLYAVKTTKKSSKQISGKHILEAVAATDENSMQNTISLTMTPKGSALWAEMTTNNIGKFIAITIDNRVLSCPMVQNAITGGETQISGNFSIKEAETLAAGINAGR